MEKSNPSSGTQSDLLPRPQTRLSKILHRSLSSERSIPSSAKENERVSEEQPTVALADKNSREATVSKNVKDEKGKCTCEIFYNTNFNVLYVLL